MIVTLLLGGNLGNRLAYLNFAKFFITRDIGEIIIESNIYESEACGDKTNKSFLNQVIEVKTKLSPQELLQELMIIEQKAGRKRKVKWGARTLDLDILFIENLIINEPNLIVPHPEIQNRNFTLKPLNEIKPNFIHPILNEKITILLDICPDKLSLKIYQK